MPLRYFARTFSTPVGNRAPRRHSPNTTVAGARRRLTDAGDHRQLACEHARRARDIGSLAGDDDPAARAQAVVEPIQLDCRAGDIVIVWLVGQWQRLALGVDDRCADD